MTGCARRVRSDRSPTSGGSSAAELGDATAMGDPVQRVVVALLDELRSGPPTVVVIEDVHWADEATLDVLGMLGRRAQQLGALVIVTYRTDELPPAHPLRIVLGDLATAAGVLRIELPPLSVDAVAALAAPHGVDAVELHAKTGRQPVLRHGGPGRGRDGHPGHDPGRRARASGAAGRAGTRTPRGGRDRPSADGAVAPRGDRPGDDGRPRRLPRLGNAPLRTPRHRVQA